MSNTKVEGVVEKAKEYGYPQTHTDHEQSIVSGLFFARPDYFAEFLDGFFEIITNLEEVSHKNIYESIKKRPVANFKEKYSLKSGICQGKSAPEGWITISI